MAINLKNISEIDSDYLSGVFSNSEFPDLEGMWELMDFAWEECECEPDVIDDRIFEFYAHPVWFLNGLFIEQHGESLNNRRVFADYVVGLKPKRVADFGGGYGTLARMIGLLCPETEVHIVEPHPHPAAISLAEKTNNVHYVSELFGKYDVLIATDVFEHVSDPLALVEETAEYLRVGGNYLIANNFWPVIQCHLPSTFHFRWSWHLALKEMNLQPGPVVSYGRSYIRGRSVFISKARRIERRSRFWFRLIERMPERIRWYVARVLMCGRI